MFLLNGQGNTCLVLFPGVEMKPILRCCYTAIIFMVAGCGNLDLRSNDVLAVPLQSSFEQEIMLIRMEQVLATAALSDDDRIGILYERGRIYDRLGLYVMARNDFSQALAIKPNIPQIFSFLGKYLTQEGNFDTAYEAFDSVLELEPTNIKARFDRGITLYYGTRYSMAQDDLLEFYRNNPQDPFGVLWLYIVEREIDEKSAKSSLQQRYNDASDRKDWGWMIVEFYLGKLSDKGLLTKLRKEITDNTSLAEHLSETYFYLGKYYLSLGDISSAVALFKLTVANNVYTSEGHRYAMLELTLLGQKQDGLSESK
jgi:lipoprotein NlpI